MIRNLTRILSIAFILFVSLFALDVFGNNFSFVALIMNLIPTFIAIILTIISWKNELWGGILWVITAIIVTFMTKIDWIITLPMIIISGLNLAAVAKGKKEEN